MKLEEIKPGMVVEATFYKYGTNVIYGKVNEIITVPMMIDGEYKEGQIVSMTVQAVITGHQDYVGYSVGVYPEDVKKEVK